MQNSIHIATLGCKVNQYESASFQSCFDELGYSITNEVSEADVIIVNTCAVTAKAGAQSRQLIRKVAKANVNARLVITGCYSQIEADSITCMEELSDRQFIFVGNDQKDKLVDTIASNIKTDIKGLLPDIMQSKTLPPLPVKKFGSRTRAYLKVQDGCDSFCTYCIVPYTRGPSRSLALDEVVKQAKTFAENGHKEIVITGIHAGNYGVDLDEKLNIITLIETLCNKLPTIQFRLSSIEPNEVTEELLSLMANTDNFLSHLHIPLQSGDTKILKLMDRKYTTEYFASMINLCHKMVPDVAIGIDVLAGFPGEDETSFSKAYTFLSSLDYTYLHVFPYSERPGTVAVTFPGKVPKETKNQRVAKLRDLSEQKRKTFYEKHLGTIRSVLIEGTKTKDGELKGFTDNYIPVLIQGEESLMYSLQKTRLIKQDGTTVFGEIVSSNER